METSNQSKQTAKSPGMAHTSPEVELMETLPGLDDIEFIQHRPLAHTSPEVELMETCLGCAYLLAIPLGRTLLRKWN